MKNKILQSSGLLVFLHFMLWSCAMTNPVHETIISIDREQFFINNEITYKNRYWNGHKIEGLLFNSRMVQGIFDDLNTETKGNFAYPDTKVWDPERNTNEFIQAMPAWKSYGLLAFTLNLQGGSPTGYGNKNWINSTFDAKGNLRSNYLERLEKILDEADRLGMIVILGYFYFGQDQILEDETAVIFAVDNITNWVLSKGYTNLLIEINNECNVRYDHEILKPQRVDELIRRVKKISNNTLLVSTSFGGNNLPSPNVIEISDYVLLHGNNANYEDIAKLVTLVRDSESYTPKPIVFNEDDHYDFEEPANNLLSAIENYASWGFFDFRREGESFEEGFQSVPVDWTISSVRKMEFFIKVKQITGN